MKAYLLPAIILLAAVSQVGAFLSPPIAAFVTKQQCSTPSSTALRMGLFDLKPFHGGGNAKEDELQEQWRLQQEKLQARRGHLTKDHLKQKYHDEFEKNAPHVAEGYTKAANKFHTREDELWYAEETHHSSAEKKVTAFKFPWQK
jgi:hypothetical protein